MQLNKFFPSLWEVLFEPTVQNPRERRDKGGLFVRLSDSSATPASFWKQREPAVFQKRKELFILYVGNEHPSQGRAAMIRLKQSRETQHRGKTPPHDLELFYPPPAIRVVYYYSSNFLVRCWNVFEHGPVQIKNVFNYYYFQPESLSVGILANATCVDFCSSGEQSQ